MKKIQLSQGYETIVDDDVYDELIKYNWHVDIFNGGVNMYARSNQVGRMHRFIVTVLKGIDVGKKFIDHEDGDGLNNRFKNFRVVTKRENNRNRKDKKLSAHSPYTGVTWKEHTKRWRAQIWIKGKTVFLGYYETPEDAGMATDRAVLYYFGDSVVLNFPNRKHEHDLSIPYDRPAKRLLDNNKTGYRGVHIRGGRFAASIGVNYERFHLGIFDTPELAAKAYDKAYIKYVGYNAKYLNFPK